MGKTQNRDYFQLLTIEEQFLYEENYNTSTKVNKDDFQDFLDKYSTSFQQFLSSGFFWLESDQGHEFWSDILQDNRYLPEWTKVYYDNIDMISDKESIIIRSGCKSINLPKKLADTIAEEMFLLGLISSFVIPENEVTKKIIYED